jgi:hypothetical protein
VLSTYRVLRTAPKKPVKRRKTAAA